MNNLRNSFLLILMIFLVSGCTKNDNNQAKTDVQDGVSESVMPIKSEPEMISDLKVEGKIRGIYYADKNKLLITADKLYLYDVDNQIVEKELTQEAVVNEKYWKVEGGYVAVRENGKSDNSEEMMMADGFDYDVIFYDYDLNIVSIFDLNQLFDEEDTLLSLDGVTFTSTGDKIAYATYLGLYTYDFEKKTKKTLIDLDSEDARGRAGIVIFEQLGFTNDNQRIAFKAQSFDIPVDPEKDSFDTCGVINTDGTTLFNQSFDDFSCRNLIAFNDLLLFAEDPIYASGRILVMEPSSQKTKTYPLSEVSESGNVWGSSKGGYFVTSTSKEDGWVIRIYDTETGKLESEQYVPIDGEELYLARSPIVKLIDESKFVIVLLGATQEDVETKMFVKQF